MKQLGGSGGRRFLQTMKVLKILLQWGHIETLNYLKYTVGLIEVTISFTYLRFFGLECLYLSFILVDNICRCGLMGIVRRFELFSEAGNNLFLLLQLQLAQ